MITEFPLAVNNDRLRQNIQTQLLKVAFIYLYADVKEPAGPTVGPLKFGFRSLPHLSNLKNGRLLFSPG